MPDGAGIPIGTIAGIRVKVQLSWFFIVALVAWSLAVSYFPSSAPGYSSRAYWAAGIVVTLLFFVSLLAHELAHSLVARARGLKVSSITLYLFGGVSSIEGEIKKPSDEALVVAVGPLTSLILSGVFAGIWALDIGSRLFDSAVGYLAAINFLLVLFNLLPGLPLDGGRLLHALVWWRTGDDLRATRIASGAGSVVGYLLVAAGIVSLFGGDWVDGLWLAFIGWYLKGSATVEEQSANVHSYFKGMRVSDLAETHPFTAAPNDTLEDVVDSIMLAHQIRAVPVADDDRFLGLITLAAIGKVPRFAWTSTLVRSAMIPSSQVVTVTPDDEVETAIMLMQQHDLNQLPVVAGGRMVGLITRAKIMIQIEIKQRLNAAGADAR